MTGATAALPQLLPGAVAEPPVPVPVPPVTFSGVLAEGWEEVLLGAAGGWGRATLSVSAACKGPMSFSRDARLEPCRGRRGGREGGGRKKGVG